MNQQNSSTLERGSRTLLEAGGAWQGLGRDLLLCYDEKDRFIAHSDGERIQALCPGATLVKTRQFGHSRILGAAALAQTVQGFLAAAVTRSPA